MNLDDLISKYLDGELNPDEDKVLRDMLSESDDNRENFDAAVIIHSACREDAASVKPPAELLERTESKILMRIMSEKPIVSESPASVYKFSARTKYSVLVAAMLVLGFLNISDLYIKNYKPLMMSVLDEQRIMLEKQAQELNSDQTQPTKTFVAVRITGIAQNKAVKYTPKATPVNTEAVDVAVNGDSPVTVPAMAVSQDNKITAENNLSTPAKQESKTADAPNVAPTFAKPLSTVNAEMLANNGNGSFKPQGQIYTLGKSKNSNLPTATNFDFYANRTDVQLSSFFGSDLARFGMNIKDGTVISHFSQGIGYPLDKKNTLGIEFGYTDYKYNDKMMVSIPAGSISPGKYSAVEVMNPGDEGGFKITVPVDINREKQIVWGSVFYELNLLDWRYFSLFSRVGAGATSDGLLGYGRLIGKIEVFPGFALTLGADSRGYQSKLTVNSVTTQNWRGSMSLIYGFQFKF